MLRNKRNLFILLLALLFALQPITSALALSDTSNKATFEIGRGFGQVRYVSTDETKYTGKYAGPLDFAVADNDNILLLDTQNKKILETKGRSLVKEYDVSFCELPTRVWTYNGVVYVLDRVGNALYVINGTHQKARKLSMPKNMEAMHVEELFYFDEKLILTAEKEYKTYNYAVVENGLVSIPLMCYVDLKLDNDVVTIVLGNKTWKLNITNSFVQIAGVDKAGNINLLVLELVPNSSIVAFETTIRKYSPEGELLGCAVIDDSNNVSNPIRAAKTNSKGEFITLHCQANSVDLEVTEISKSYVSNTNMLKRRAKMHNAFVGDIVETNVVYSNLTRNQVRSEAMSMINATWTLTRNHLTPPNGAIGIPYTTIVGTIPTSGVQMTGLPYCWGGMNGISSVGTAEHLLSFNTLINRTYGNTGSYYYPGNQGVRGTNYVSGTCGVDCSGFVALAFGLTTKRGTSWFHQNFGDAISHSTLSRMDILVKSDYHMVLFDYFSSSGYYTVIEATTVVSQTNELIYKAVAHTRSSSDFTGYQAKKPWR